MVDNGQRLVTIVAVKKWQMIFTNELLLSNDDSRFTILRRPWKINDVFSFLREIATNGC